MWSEKEHATMFFLSEKSSLRVCCKTIYVKIKRMYEATINIMLCLERSLT